MKSKSCEKCKIISSHIRRKTYRSISLIHGFHRQCENEHFCSESCVSVIHFTSVENKNSVFYGYECASPAGWEFILFHVFHHNLHDIHFRMAIILLSLKLFRKDAQSFSYLPVVRSREPLDFLRLMNLTMVSQ